MAKIKCPACGRPIEDTEAFCPYCGFATGASPENADKEPMPEKKADRLPSAALILGIIGLVTSCAGIPGLLLGVGAMVLSACALKGTDKETPKTAAYKKAVGALVLGALAAGIAAAELLFLHH